MRAGACTAVGGFTMMLVLFILVGLSALGATLAVVSSRHQMGSAQELAAAKAHQAARAGLEWATFKLARSPSPQPACFAAQNIALSGELTGMTVSVTCTRNPSSGVLSDGPQNLAFYRVVANACNAPNGTGACPSANLAPDVTYVESQLTRTLSL
jgi:MSHA biogenesis protein MshP